MLVTCSCGTNNRIPSTGVRQRIRCGQCKHVFTPSELVAARPEPPPPPPEIDLSQIFGEDGIPRVTDAPDEGDYDEEDEDAY